MGRRPFLRTLPGPSVVNAGLRYQIEIGTLVQGQVSTAQR